MGEVKYSYSRVETYNKCPWKYKLKYIDMHCDTIPAMYDRKNEIAIMKMVGATNGFIRLPFVVEGFTLGMLGAGLAFGLEWVMYDALVARLAVVDTLKLFSFVPFSQLLGIQG